MGAEVDALRLLISISGLTLRRNVIGLNNQTSATDSGLRNGVGDTASVTDTSTAVLRCYVTLEPT